MTDPEHSVAQILHDRLACLRIEIEEATLETQEWYRQAKADEVQP